MQWIVAYFVVCVKHIRYEALLFNGDLSLS